MNETVTITCDKCQTRFRIKPGMLKVMKTIRCSKCGHAIPASQVVPLPSSPVVSQEIQPPVTPLITNPSPVEAARPAPVFEKKDESPAVEILRLIAEVETLKNKLHAVEQELAESDARIASLQELWHSKELEAREMSERATRAEQECRNAIAVRDEFLAKAKSELAAYLVGERDAALTRFAELEKRLRPPNHRS